ncbi:MAG: pimeloyl-CoA dehydrogenase small subunit [Alphaproteobacteria bacterium]|jgi:alkylation response protein AidB-like acyl-CoA dehydrogenase|nr:pimeloyl-CoA dehydrogenase small subunit [Alphaproteobacteria bacterium]MBT4019080.1 pimeloyl-CoA dehydrogenase small subunit [Alphaproteobacteria bacterium]MBT4966467.1 pimeloyl-CoA dehydrogenase small subunit [Alphaproteobacteria bacterium]MBT5159098.1 pimeloyl-CoA dehydrogenase small subunit [Alphaproteobacteria bacterium]MBT5918830.1 pimeloyl-CoA dehydrogenase small subunit [Alphaproteobacteria bacterium]
MDFELSSEQTLLKDSVDRFVKDNYELAARRALVASDLGFSKDNWDLFAEMGWLGLPFSEESGGYGGSNVDVSILMESFGEGLVVEPYMATVLLGGRLVEMAGTADQKETILAAVIEGKMQLAFGYSEPQSRFDLFDVTTTATASGDGYVLNGHKGLVYHAGSADKIIVTARSPGGQRDKAGISLFIVDANTKGLSLKSYRTLDGQRASEVILDGVEVGRDAMLGAEGQAFPIVEKVTDLAIGAASAEAVGAMRRVNQMTIEYVKTRQQFGSPIGSNQVIKHRLADMLIEEEQSKAMSDMAAMRADMAKETRSDDQVQTASATKARIGEAAKFVGEQGIQLHGGIGMTDEYAIGHYYKRLQTIDKLFGNVDYHLRRFSDAR